MHEVEQPGSAEGALIAEHKVRVYPAVAAAAHAVRHCPVWTVEGERQKATATAVLPLCEELEQQALEASFFAPRQVNEALTALVDAGVEFAGMIAAIQTKTDRILGAPHDIDRRWLAEYEQEAHNLDAAVAEFITAARRDLGIDDMWEPAPSAAGGLEAARDAKTKTTPRAHQPPSGEDGAARQHSGIARRVAASGARTTPAERSTRHDSPDRPRARVDIRYCGSRPRSTR